MSGEGAGGCGGGGSGGVPWGVPVCVEGVVGPFLQ